MAWWDSHRPPLRGSPRSRPRLIMGDAFPRLEPKQFEMERERALLSPVFEELPGPPSVPSLVVHVEIQFTDPVIRSRYCRSYGSSPAFEATNRLCRGLVRRIERCSEELITRKDSAALDMFKDGSHERKPQRFEMTFRIMRRGKGEWAERTYRSYQKQPLTVALTSDIILAAHRMIGLFLRRHDEKFQWLDCPVPDADSDGCETVVPSRDRPLSLLSVPRSLFIEATQTFEFVPGYRIELCFRSKNPQRRFPLFERRLRVSSTQTSPLTLFASEDLLWKALEAVSQGLDAKKRELDNHVREEDCRVSNLQFDDDALEIDLRISNNLGPAFKHVHRNINSKLALFRDPDAADCHDFLHNVESFLVRLRDEADAKVDAMDDFDFRILELKGVGWTVREPARFTLGPSASYGRRTIQAALDRIQTGIGDVIRGHNVAIHITAHKRGHLVLDKAIVAHEKRGMPKETFASAEAAKSVLVSRLKSRVQMDIDKVFEDSCAIDDIPEDEEDDVARPSTPVRPDQSLPEGQSSPGRSPSSIRYSPSRQSRTLPVRVQTSPRPLAQRVFSLSRRSTESVTSIDYLKAAQEPLVNKNSRPSTPASEPDSKQHQNERGNRAPLVIVAEVKPAHRSFPLVPKRDISAVRTNNSSSLVDEDEVANIDDHDRSERNHDGLGAASKNCNQHGMTSRDAGEEPAGGSTTGKVLAEAASTPLNAGFPSNSAGQQIESPRQDDESTHVQSAGYEFKRRKMDTPEAFEDAREFTASPAFGQLAKAETPIALFGDASPRYDEYSTAPSTPELSTGGSSPRHSVLITPTFLRTISGNKDAELPGLYPEGEHEDPRIHFAAEIGAASATTEDRGHLIPGEHPIGQSKFGPPLQSIAASGLAAEPPGTVDGADGDLVAGNPEPIAGAPVRHEIPDARPTATPFSNIGPTSSSASDANAETAPERQTSGERLGAEYDAGSDTRSSAPDFPTPEVRIASDPSEELQQASVSNNVDNSGLGPDHGSEVLVASKEYETGGDQLGAAAGTEDKTVREDGSNEAVPQGTEADSEEKKVPRTVSGSETVDDTERHVPSDGIVNGPGLVAEEQQQQPMTDDVRGSHGWDLPTPEVLLDERLEGSSGLSSGTKVRHAEPEDKLLGKGLEIAADGHTTSGPDLSTGVESSGPDAAPDDTTGKSEPQGDDRITAPTDTGAEDDTDLRAGQGAAGDGPEDHAVPREGDAVGPVGHEAVTEALAALPEVDGKKQPCGEEAQDGLTAASASAESTRPGVAKPDASNDAVDEDHDRGVSSAVAVVPEDTRVQITKPDGSEVAAERTGQEAAAGFGADNFSQHYEKDSVDEDVRNTLAPEVKSLRLGHGDGLLVGADGPSEGHIGTTIEAEAKTSELEPVNETAGESDIRDRDNVSPSKPDVSKSDSEKNSVNADGTSGESSVAPEGLAEELEVEDNSVTPREDGGFKGEPWPRLQVVTKDGDLAPSDRLGIPADTEALSAETEAPAAKSTIRKPEHQEQKQPSALAPIPDVALLFPRGTNLSSSTIQDTDASSFVSHTFTRGSVDTFRPSTDDDTFRHLLLPESDHPLAPSRPQTAGYLGLRGAEPRSRFVEVGLFPDDDDDGDDSSNAAKKTGRRRRLSLPLFMLDQQQQQMLGQGLPPSAPASEAGWTKKKSRRVPAGTSTNAAPEGTGGGDDGATAVVPRIMMMLAGAVAIGKIMKRASGE